LIWCVDSQHKGSRQPPQSRKAVAKKKVLGVSKCLKY
jgi:hypothetical protein